jgi:hypothetical protein
MAMTTSSARAPLPKGLAGRRSTCAMPGKFDHSARSLKVAFQSA